MVCGDSAESGSSGGIFLLHLLSRPGMAAAAEGITNKQGAVAAMEPCMRHGRGASGNAVKVKMLSLEHR